MKRSLIVFIGLIALLGACIPLGGPTEPDENAIGTQVMQTAVAQQTQSAFETLVAQLSATPPQGPTAVLPPDVITQVVAVEVTPLPTATLPPTPTQVPTLAPTATAVIIPTITPTPIPCNWAQFEKDVTIADGTEFAPGESFTKTWRLKNIGSCTWTPDYALVYAGGSQMNGPSAQPLGVTVQPGQTVDVSVKLASPQGPGSCTGNWQLRSQNGALFGIGSAANSAFWVKINVKAVPTEKGLLYDFAANYCSAEWRTGYGVISCPTSSGDASNGSITRTNAPVFEGGYKDNQATLVVVPSSGKDGVIVGKFPAFKVQDGTDFTTYVGCMDNSPKCDVTIQLNYIADGGPVQNLASWTQKSDGSTQKVILDLNALAGKSVQFLLTVYNNGDSTDDRVFWLLPAIR
jgi:hypothetical protein